MVVMMMMVLVSFILAAVLSGLLYLLCCTGEIMDQFEVESQHACEFVFCFDVFLSTAPCRMWRGIIDCCPFGGVLSCLPSLGALFPGRPGCCLATLGGHSTISISSSLPYLLDSAPEVRRERQPTKMVRFRPPNYHRPIFTRHYPSTPSRYSICHHRSRLD